MAENKNSKARIAANNRYNAKVYDRINIAVPKGKKEIIQSHARNYGESINGFVNRAIDEAIERDHRAQPTQQQESYQMPLESDEDFKARRDVDRLKNGI